MNEEEFLLKWNNHQTNFVDVFNHLLQDDAFVDVTLVCGGEAVLGHKMVLAACSPLLHRILRDNPCRHPVLILSDVPAGDMRAMMKFIYQGEVSVSQSELASFLKTADNLQIKGLAEDKEKEKSKEHKSKEDRKRKDKESNDRSDSRSSHKRQRLSDSRVAEVGLTLPHRSHKYSDSHSSHKKNNKPSSDHSPKNGGSMNNASAQKHTSSRTSSSTKMEHRDIPTKVLHSSKENAIFHVNTSSNVMDNILQKNAKTEEMTIKMEPLDYPGEMMWTEGHGTINTDILDDHQPLTLASLPGALDAVAVRFGTSPNLQKLDSNDDGRCDEESRGDLSIASDDINANTTGGTWGTDSIPQGSTRDIGTLPPPAHPGIHPLHSSIPHPPTLVHPPLITSSILPLPPLPPLPPLHPQLERSDALVHGAPSGSLVQPTSPPLSTSLPCTASVYTSSGAVPLSISTSSCIDLKFATTITSSNLNNNSVHKCQQCPFVTSNPYTFTRHLRIHLGTKEFRCRVCTFASSRKDSLIRHFRMKHLTGEMSLYQDLDSRDIEELALARNLPEGVHHFT